ncbi:MAG TPA: hypothetical protein V6D25_01400 [Leptolyngbyaceae cyanobacterium]
MQIANVYSFYKEELWVEVKFKDGNTRNIICRRFGVYNLDSQPSNTREAVCYVSRTELTQEEFTEIDKFRVPDLGYWKVAELSKAQPPEPTGFFLGLIQDKSH